MKSVNVTLQKIAVAFAVVLFASAIIWYGWRIKDFFKYTVDLAPKIEQDYAFKIGTPYVKFGESSSEVLVIYPEEGGYLYQLGFRNGDIVISEDTVEFYKSLHKFSEDKKMMSITVVDGGDGLPLENRRKRVLTFRRK